MDDLDTTREFTPTVRKAAKFVFVLLLLGGVALKRVAESYDPPRTTAEFRQRAALPPEHLPVFGTSNVSVGKTVKIAAHHAKVADEQVTWHPTLLLSKRAAETSSVATAALLGLTFVWRRNRQAPNQPEAQET